jgi:site-specific recombinase XerD
MDRLLKALPDYELQAILGHFDSHTATGRRDLAMMPCMSDLGPRVSKVIALTLDDLERQRATLTIQGGKAGHGRGLPMPAPLRQAISA